jgi:Asp/Glu/hydantoin racemase
MEEDEISEGILRRMGFYIRAAEAMGVDALFNACSSLGPVFDAAKGLVSIPMVKIDDGMAEEAAKEGERIVVMATLPTTLKPIVDLIQEKAAGMGKQIEI